MKTKTRSAILTILLLFLSGSVLADELPQIVTAAALGFDDVKDISSGFTTEVIDMHVGEGGVGIFHHLSFEMTIAWGTTTEMEVRLLESSKSSGPFRANVRCSSAEVHSCKPRRWKFESGDGTTPTLDFPHTKHQYLKIQIVAGSGDGKVKGTATRGP